MSLPDRLQAVKQALASGPKTKTELSDILNISEEAAASYARKLRTYDIDLTHDTNGYRLVETDTSFDGLDAIEQGSDPDPDSLTDRERVIAHELQTGATIEELASEFDERDSVIHQHLRDLKREGWQVYVDESAGHIAIEGDNLLRSSEHKGTRTRKANQWWELTHNKLVREFKTLQTPTSELDETSGNEDWVLHMTDLHAGDRVRLEDGTVVYSTGEIPSIINHITERAIGLADKHGSEYDTGHLLWGGDFVTNEGIYEGQFEDLDAWLDEQHETLITPLIKQIKAFSNRFETVQVVCQVGNHGQHRASGTSRQANADLILYKSIRNAIAQIRKHSELLDNVTFLLGQARPFRNFELRGGELVGHLRHGQHRRPQAETSARQKEWVNTLRDHNFDVCATGHWHISGRIPWDGPPIICSSSPKPSGEFVERIGERIGGGKQGMATAFGMADDGLTAVFPIDSRHYE